MSQLQLRRQEPNRQQEDLDSQNSLDFRAESVAAQWKKDRIG
jgi:hypothetical protein